MTLDQFGEHPEGLTNFQAQIMERVESAKSIKVLNKAFDLVTMGADFGGQWGDDVIKKVIMELENDLDTCVFSGEYNEWTSEDVKELLFVLTGEKEDEGNEKEKKEVEM